MSKADGVSVRLRWVVAGKNGLELHGYATENEMHERNEPCVRVRCSPLHWDFSFKSIRGSGRVRVGAGCSYNPLQMVEAMWGHLVDGTSPTDAASEDDAGHTITAESLEAVWDPKKVESDWSEFLIGDDGDEWV